MKSFWRYALRTLRMRACTNFLPNKIAEEASKGFMYIALGNAFELETALILTKELNLSSASEVDEILLLVKEERRMIYSFTQLLDNSGTLNFSLSSLNRQT